MLKTLQTAMMILNKFTIEKSSWTARELSEELDLPQVNVYRILESFEQGDYVIKNDITKQYQLGKRLVQLSEIAGKKRDVVELLRPEMRKLMHETGEAVFLVGLNGVQGVTLDALVPENKVGFSIALDGRAPLYAGASYWSMLAYLGNDLINRTEKGSFEALLSPRTLTPQLLEEKLAFVRKYHWVSSHGQFTPDIIAVASPLFLNAHVIGSVTIAKPTYRVKENDEQEIGAAVKKTADRLNTLLNFHQINLDYYVYFRNRHTNEKQ
ncbi:IclR family transcriptional regulator [Sporolactobacillus kofuensis]|uniref:IclR family transcriptional regulator n=1 Tax=Sporolactobacillus kofuensis TaxID=269672 RepID=A0ABW1WCR1_9BACL|nr:IclR family transcriptional regulator [Sporolactobacillus kofuensis]MCO7174861.1 IclR family transcriptional regulator [Sporolactobacillus kofuensis]